MHELYPGEIIQMSILTGYHKARRNHGGRLLGFGAVSMDVSSTVGMVGVMLEFKEARAEWSQQAAPRTEHPTWEGRYRHADAGRFIEWIRQPSGFRHSGGREQLLHLRTQFPAYRA